MFTSVLIANRGEIACRIARTAKRLGLRTVAVYSAADANALHVRMCDEAHFIGEAEPRQSYLNIERLIATAQKTGAQCVHPGYGFLSENADFAEACAKAGLVFVGPPADAIRAMGLKDIAKSLMEKARVPIVPGYHGERQDVKVLKEKAYELGYPVLIKPAAGGGGRGMRRVDRHADFDSALEGAIREAQSSFGSGRVLIEKYVLSPRHIEVQVFADNFGNAIHLGERDCSLQRRHQKVIEESPAPGMTEDLRRKIGAAAVEAAKAVGYSGAGTVEFVADGSKGLRADAFWFIEMNTRLQVEHPVTEAVTGLDLIAEQIAIADGRGLRLQQAEVRTTGCAIECRVNAEDYRNDFKPSPGRIRDVSWPAGAAIRVDSHVVPGSSIPPFYDSLMGKIIASGPDRADALARMRDAIAVTCISGVKSNLGFHSAALDDPEFQTGGVDTGFVDRLYARRPDLSEQGEAGTAHG
jgi:3-methylcrotonyl-CoA carboxylase alpha subunit